MKQTKLQILATAKKMLLEDNSPVTISRVAGKAGFSRTTVYRCFHNIEQLLEEIAGQSFEELQTALLATAVNQQHAVARLADIVAVHYMLASRWAPLLLPSVARKQVLAENMSALAQVYADVLAAGITAGQLREHNPEVVAAGLAGLVHNLAVFAPGSSPGEAVRETLWLVASGIATEKGTLAFKNLLAAALAEIETRLV